MKGKIVFLTMLLTLVLSSSAMARHRDLDDCGCNNGFIGGNYGCDLGCDYGLGQQQGIPFGQKGLPCGKKGIGFGQAGLGFGLDYPGYWGGYRHRGFFGPGFGFGYRHHHRGWRY